MTDPARAPRARVPRSPSSPLHVVVVGAGIGGLAAAAGLQHVGAQVTVLEQAARLLPVGAGLSLFGNGFTALDSLGLGDAVRAIAGSQARGLRGGQRTPSGRWLATVPAHAMKDLRVVHRAELQQALLAALAPGTVRTGASVVAVDPEGEVRIAPAPDTDGSGPPTSADVVIAADGLHSRVRAGWQGPGTRYAGYTAWRGVTAVPVDLGGEAGETWGRGLRFGLVPLRDDRVYWFAVISLPEGASVPGDGPDDRMRLQRIFGSWHAPISEIIEATPAEAVIRSAVHELARPVASFTNGRVALLGDAAHAMTPDLGQGANQALEDAATLVALLRSAGGGTVDADAVPGALLDYDRLRRPRSQRVAAQAHRVGAIAQAGAPVSATLRDAALRIMPARLLSRPLLTLQQWQPPGYEPARRW